MTAVLYKFDRFVTDGGLDTDHTKRFVAGFYGLDPIDREQVDEYVDLFTTNPKWREAYQGALYTQAIEGQQHWQESCTDPLTGLNNRKGWEFQTRHRMAAVTAYNQEHQAEIKAGTMEPRRLVGMFIDVNRLKDVNDSFGHAHGDSVLEHVGEHIRSRDILGVHVSGDEFAIVAFTETQVDPLGMGKRRSRPVEERVEAFKARLQRELQPFFEEVGVRGLGVSIGSIIWDGKQTFEQFKKALDDAMYQQKLQNNESLFLSNPRGLRMLARFGKFLLKLSGNAGRDIRALR